MANLTRWGADSDDALQATSERHGAPRYIRKHPELHRSFWHHAAIAKRHALRALPRLMRSHRMQQRMKPPPGVEGATKPLYGRCAFVGSGHDLRCNPKGREIDAYEAVFRANAAQQLDNPASAVAAPGIAGNRTDFRVGCLHRSRALPSMRHEVCIVPANW